MVNELGMCRIANAGAHHLYHGCRPFSGDKGCNLNDDLGGRVNMTRVRLRFRLDCDRLTLLLVLVPLALSCGREKRRAGAGTGMAVGGMSDM
jgi:hypothetical protein